MTAYIHKKKKINILSPQRIIKTVKYVANWGLITYRIFFVCINQSKHWETGQQLQKMTILLRFHISNTVFVIIHYSFWCLFVLRELFRMTTSRVRTKENGDRFQTLCRGVGMMFPGPALLKVHAFYWIGILQFFRTKKKWILGRNRAFFKQWYGWEIWFRNAQRHRTTISTLKT